MTKRLMVLVLVTMLVFLTTGCFAVDPDMVYVGDYPELATTAYYSIPGIASSREDDFIILDDDPYGRVLFAAYLPDGALISSSFYDGVLAVIIMQGRSDSDVQFYGEKNYMARIVSTTINLNEELIYQYFSEEEIAALKVANDWNCVTAEGNSIHIPLSVEKNVRLSSKMRKQLEKSIGTNIKYSFFRECADGTKIFFVLNISKTMPKYTWYLVAFDDKGVLIEDSVKNIPKDLEELPSSVDSFLSALSLTTA